MTLDEHLVATTGVRLAAEEVVEADLVERCRGGIGGDVAAHAHAGPLRPVHHDGRVPADPAPVAALHLFVPGEPRLEFGGDGVDVVGGGERRDGHPLLAGAFQHPQHQVAGAGRTRPRQQGVEGLQPLGGLVRVDIRQVGRHTVSNDAHPVGVLAAAGIRGPVGVGDLGGQIPLLGSEGDALGVSLSCRTQRVRGR